MTTTLDNWEKNAISVDVQRDWRKLNLQQVRLECSWCDKHHCVVKDRTQIQSGYMLCSNCGQFFKWRAADDNSITNRVRAHPSILPKPGAVHDPQRQ